MTSINKAADRVLSWLLRSEIAEAQERVQACRCQGGAAADASCASRIGWYCRSCGSCPWYFNGCC